MDAKDAADEPTSAPSDAVDAAAAEWVIRLGGLPLTADERKALDTWLGANRQHRKSFELARRAWGEPSSVSFETRGAMAPATMIPTAMTPAATTPAATTPATMTPAVHPTRSPHASNPNAGANARARARATATTRTWHVPAAVAASVLIAFCAIGLYRSIAWNAIGADYYTRVGEVRSAALPDGSTITLDTHSAVTLNFAEGARHVRLLEGAAKFDVARGADAERHPFVVEVGNRRVRAQGTSFVVSSDRGNVCVQVLEHSVLVSRMDRPSAADPLVRDGERLCLAERASGGRIEAAPPTPASTWEHGRLQFDRAPLRDAVAQLNRYRRVPLMIIGAELRERRISGVFQLAELDNASESIGRQLRVRVLNVPGLVTLIY
ncbi:MAG: FecR domain-containing protein [Gammaproteobacteria bacterium]